MNAVTWSSQIQGNPRDFWAAFAEWEFLNVNALKYARLSLAAQGVIKNPGVFFCCYDEGRPAGFFTEGPGGLGLPLFLPDSYSKLEAFFSSFPFEKSFRSLMGPAEIVSAIEKKRPKEKRTGVDYFLMLHSGEAAAEDAAPGDELREITVRKAGQEDTEKIFPLQRAYELEEVVLNPRRFNDFSCRRNLQKNLSQEYVLAAWKDGMCLAKAGTNATGLSYCQVGGVYTLPAWRNRGLSSLLMNRLIADLGRNNKRLCLFAKRQNAAAIRVYQKCGFEITGNFRISYLF